MELACILTDLNWKKKFDIAKLKLAEWSHASSLAAQTQPL